MAPCRKDAEFQQVAGKRAEKQGTILPAMLKSALMPFPEHFLIINHKKIRCLFSDTNSTNTWLLALK